MASYYAFAAPVLPGQLEVWKSMVNEINTTRRKEYRAARKKMGITQESAWLQHTPMGDFVVVYVEGRQADKLMEKFNASKDPFDMWFSKQIAQIHGLTGPPPPVNEIHIDIL
ncbi:MAG: hypothetical protein OK455_10395 [Thaumarchaeota archaeon]|nr:hypothetical protein [Nitrososphaerota archaeon]